MNRSVTALVVLLSAVFLIGAQATAQIFGPEGMNLPGSYNGFTNPPSIPAFAGIQGPGTFLLDAGLTTDRYQTRVYVNTVGADIIGGTYTYLYTSGPGGGYFNNKWADVVTIIDSLQAATYYTSGGTDNSVTLVDGKYYTVNYKDAGYMNTTAVWMATTEIPETVLTVTQSPVAALVNQFSGVTVSFTLSSSATGNTEEKFFVRYTTNGWVSSSVVQATMAGASGSAVIPVQAGGTNVQYYVLSTTKADPSFDYDMYTLKYNNNGGANYGYTVHAALSGSKSIPGDYATIKAAVDTLNAFGVASGGVTFNVAAGHTETNSEIILRDSTASSSATVTFQKSGSGANPKVTAGVGVSTTLDGIIKIAGTDYVTFDSIDVAENAANLTATTQMEWGYAVLKGSPTNGSQNVTIKNCTITMIKTNTATYGIYHNNHSATLTTAYTVTAASGTNSNNKYYGNTITNTYQGIILNGFADVTPFALYDQSNEVGVTAGNIITNFGGSSVAIRVIEGVRQNNLKIHNNSITGGSGTTTTARAIYLSTGTNASAEIVNNTISITSSATASQFSGIENNGYGGTGSVILIKKNTIGATYTTATSGTFQGIWQNNATAGSTVTIDSNTISGVTVSGTGTVHGIRAADMGTNTLNVRANNVSTMSKTGASGNLYGIELGTATLTASYNNIRVLTIAATSGATASNINGYRNFGSALSETINNNNIDSLIIGGAGTSTSTIIRGIYTFTVSGAVKSIHSNIVHTMTSHIGTVSGIENNLGAPAHIYKNRVYNLQCGATGGVVNGILLTAGTTQYAYNNFISDLRAPASTNATTGVVGLNIFGGTTANAYFNTIRLNATSSGTTFGTTGIFASTATTVELRNNIVVNLSTPGTTGGFVAAYRRSSTTLTSYSAPSNNNDFYVDPTLGVRRYHYGQGATPADHDSTIAAFKTRVGPRDASSFAENPPFVNAATTPYDLHMNTAIATQTESGGSPVTTPVAITDDYDANARNVSTPDIGADEFAGTGLDLAPPAVSYTPLSNTSLFTARTLSTSITDAGSGVPTAGAGLPVLYWRINSGSYTPATGSYISGSTYEFTLGAGVALNDTVRYYIVSQDLAGTPNVGSTPAGGSGFTANPPAAATPPASPSSYLIVSPPLSGDYTVGTTFFNQSLGKNITFERRTRKVTVQVPVQNPNVSKTDKQNDGNALYTDFTGEMKSAEVEEEYFVPMENGREYTGPFYVAGATENLPGAYLTITAAVADLVLRGVSGATRLLLIDPSYAESGIVIPAISGASSTNTIKIEPNTGVASAVSGSSTAAIFKLNGADYVTIDGLNTGGSSLSVTNTNASGAVIWIGSASASDPATNNAIKNLAISGSGGAGSPVGIVAGSGTTLGGAAEAANSDNVIQNNSFKNSQNGVFISGATALDQNWSITGNSFGSTVTAEKHSFRGMLIGNAQNFTISNNTIAGVLSTTSSTASGIQISGLINTGSVTLNKISDIRNTNTGGWGSNGIFLASTSTTAAVSVYNNFVSSVASHGYTLGAGAADNGYGIIAASGAGYNVDFNTVRMNQDQAVDGLPAAFNVVSTVTTGAINLRNNILVSSQTVGVQRYSIYSGAANTVFTTINHNDYFATGPNLGFIGSNRATLADIVTGFGQNVNSISSNPTFVSSTDHHISPYSPSALNAAGVTVSGISTDIDGDTRAATPDIGADEFTLVSPGAFTLTAPADGSIGQPVSGTLSWSSSSGATAYDVYMDGNPVPVAIVSANQPGTSYAYSVPAGTYYWDVVAKNGNGNTNSGNGPFDFTTVVPPAAPSALTLTLLGPVPPSSAISPVEIRKAFAALEEAGASKAEFNALENQINGVTLTADAVSGIQLSFTDNAASGPNTEDSFYVYAKLGSAPAIGGHSSPDFLAALDSSAGSGGTVNYSHTTLNIDEHWYYKVTAKNAQGESSPASADTTTGAATPGTPTFSDVAWNRMKVYIAENGNTATVTYAIHETSTNMYLAANGTLSSATAVWQTYAAWGGASGKLVTGLTRGTSYTFEVKARNSANVETGFGTSGSQATNYDQPLPSLSENFTQVAFPPAGWTLLDEVSVRWSRNTVSTQPDNLVGPMAKVDFFNASAGETDTLITPMLNLTGALDASLNWSHSYRTYTSLDPDSVFVIISSDGGTTWSILNSDGYPNMATRPPSTSSLGPVAAADWRANTVGIPGAYWGASTKIGWVSKSAFGNNYWLDDITILKKAHPDTLIVRKYEDIDGDFNTTGDRSLKSWYLQVNKDSVGGTLIASGTTDSLFVTNLVDGTYIVSEADSSGDGWRVEGHVVNGVPVVNTTIRDTVVFSGGGLTRTVDFVNTTAPLPSPVFTSNPPSLDLGEVVKNSSGTDTLYVKNTGNAVMLIDSVKTGGGEFSVSPNGTSTIAVGDSGLFLVTFSPTISGAQSGVVIFYSNTLTSSDSVSVSGEAIQGIFSVNPTSLNIGNVVKNDSGTDSVLVKNVGFSALAIDSVRSYGGEFSVLPNGSAVLAAGDSAYYAITFSPSAAGAQTGDVVFYTDSKSSPDTVDVSGTGIQAIFTVNPSSIAFSGVMVGDSLKDTVYAYNTGASVLNISSIASSSADYSVTPSGSTLMPGESLLVVVFFHPAAPGASSGAVIFNHNGKTTPDSVSLSGVGFVASYFLSLSPDSVFNEDPLKPGKSKKPVKRNKGLYPNWSNLLDETNAQGGFGPGATESDSAGGMVIGKSYMFNAGGSGPAAKWKAVKDSAKIRGWVRLAKWDFKKSIGKSFANIQKTLIDKTIGKHTGPASGFDTTTDGKNKPIFKQQTKLTPKKQSNKLFAELIALKVNIAASAMGKTPSGLGDLVFDTDGNFLDEMTILQIADTADQMMTLFQGHTQAEYDSLYSAVYNINRAFLGPMDTITFNTPDSTHPLGKLTVAGQVDVNTVSYLKVPSPFVATRTYALNSEVESPEDFDFDDEEFEDAEGTTPVAAKLYQNYPNPFNPSTTIAFRLLESSVVTVRVFNMLGQEIATLVSGEEFDEGVQAVEFAADQLSSGVYFYRIDAQGLEDEGLRTVETRKMILMK